MSERIIDLRNLGDDFIIYFGGTDEVDARAFASSLLALANSIRAVNAILNPDDEIEIFIEITGPLGAPEGDGWTARS